MITGVCSCNRLAERVTRGFMRIGAESRSLATCRLDATAPPKYIFMSMRYTGATVYTCG
jgi:hypothetical protein